MDNIKNEHSNYMSVINSRDCALNSLKESLPKELLTKESLIEIKSNIESYLNAESILNPIKIAEKTFDGIDDIFSKQSVILSLYDSIKYTFKRELSKLNVSSGFWVVEDEDKNFYISNRPFSLEALRDTNFIYTDEGKFFNFFDMETSTKIMNDYITRVKDRVEGIFDNPKYKVVGVKFRIRWEV